MSSLSSLLEDEVDDEWVGGGGGDGCGGGGGDGCGGGGGDGCGGGGGDGCGGCGGGSHSRRTALTHRTSSSLHCKSSVWCRRKHRSAQPTP